VVVVEAVIVTEAQVDRARFGVPVPGDVVL
jgi:hypothetical protein